MFWHCRLPQLLPQVSLGPGALGGTLHAITITQGQVTTNWERISTNITTSHIAALDIFEMNSGAASSLVARGSPPHKIMGARSYQVKGRVASAQMPRGSEGHCMQRAGRPRGIRNWDQVGCPGIAQMGLDE